MLISDEAQARLDQYVTRWTAEINPTAYTDLFASTANYGWTAEALIAGQLLTEAEALIAGQLLTEGLFAADEVLP